MTIETKA